MALFLERNYGSVLRVAESSGGREGVCVCVSVCLFLEWLKYQEGVCVHG